MTNEEAIKLLKILAQHEASGDVWWKENPDGTLSAFVNCNDLFFWGCADAEELIEDKFEMLEQSFEDGGVWGSLLFCARVRGMRPQGEYYKHINKDVHSHFDSCGPVREVGFMNPGAHPIDLYEA